MLSNLKRRLKPEVLRDELVEEALHESEERFYKAFHANPAATSISTLDGRYLDVNASFLKILGYERLELIGHHARELGIWVELNARTRAVERLQSE